MAKQTDTTAVTMLVSTSSRYGFLEKGKTYDVPTDTAARWQEYRIAKPAGSSGSRKAKTAPKSGDMNAKDAVAHIEAMEPEKLAGFLSEGESRKTVLEAYEARTGAA